VAAVALDFDYLVTHVDIDDNPGATPCPALSKRSPTVARAMQGKSQPGAGVFL
jgi:hypothetical protein